MHLKPLGESAWLLSFDDEDSARRWARAWEAESLPGVTDIVPAYRTVGVYADGHVDATALEARLMSFRPGATTADAERLHVVPVLYDGEDLWESAEALGISTDDLIALHASVDYRVHAIGFQPGFPYLGYLPAPLDRLARRSRPRGKVPAGSVAVAAGQTGIYPAELPGGWNLLGRTPLIIVDLRDGYFPIRTGDLVRFRPIEEQEFESLKGTRL